MNRLFLSAICLVCLSSILQATGGFDTPIHKKQTTLTPDMTKTGNYKIVSCFYYDTFMVKETNTCAQANCDGKDEGAERLSLVTISKDAGQPVCQTTQTPNETEIPVTGHFMGSKSPYVFFKESQEIGGPERFQAFDGKTGKKKFEDTTWDGKITVLSLQGPTLKFRFKRAVSPGCPMELQAKECWDNIKTSLRKDFNGISMRFPNCSDKFFEGHSLWVGYNAEGVF